jgi:hypothetical protein
MEANSPLIISSLVELEIHHKASRKAKRDCSGYRSSVVIFPPDNEPHLLLVKFVSVTIDREIQAMIDQIRTEHRKALKNYQKTVKAVLTRNHAGYVRCRDSIYQIFLIKRFTTGSVFDIIGIDVVRIIAKMLYSTIGTKPWCL